MEANNKACREALETVRKYIKETPYDKVMLGVIEVWCDEALAAPARNCDMGTAEEQTARIRKLCTKFKPSCIGCPCYGDIHRVNCWLTWAQMPYKEGDDDGSK